ncbi:response regulator [Brevibacillus choshinensis]|uniref:Transcriptional regulatory protein n=1 Tax=Brevibacillus choshinensis TaxID=54911 RepID=A0ABR5N5A4_BRECH|nr:response regulator [Brevibacillus choshinensis]KQL45617.1 chemotaxis protein CheY [Brevibacillus choshinensis]MED4583064.1 response regulator [Brevibacillus choshinensis]MED4752980.1 response regulator [Brevibacillus choshinensis]MED4781444.1 response regulator [Brevibacillus choshinensis]
MNQHQSDEANRIRVLIIEDDLRIAEVNRRFVEKISGYEVVGIAADKEEAKDQLELLQPELVLLDVYFPDMNGLEFLSYIKEHHPGSDVIMLTAAKEVDAVVDAIRYGVFDFITKPLIFSRLQQTLRSYQDFRKKIHVLKKEGESINQEEIDQLVHGSGVKSSKESRPVKGIDRITLEKITSYLMQTEEATTDQVSKETGISRSTARRYLEYLVTMGEANADLSYGVVGRPERVYRRGSKAKG